MFFNFTVVNVSNKLLTHHHQHITINSNNHFVLSQASSNHVFQRTPIQSTQNPIKPPIAHFSSESLIATSDMYTQARVITAPPNWESTYLTYILYIYPAQKVQLCPSSVTSYIASSIFPERSKCHKEADRNLRARETRCASNWRCRGHYALLLARSGDSRLAAPGPGRDHSFFPQGQWHLMVTYIPLAKKVSWKISFCTFFFSCNSIFRYLEKWLIPKNKYKEMNSAYKSLLDK